MKREKESQARLLKSTHLEVDGFEYTLLNNEKLGRVLDLIEGVGSFSDEDKRALADCKQLKLSDSMTVLALYDRLGGGVKLGERKVSMGAFFDFGTRTPRTEVEIDESDFEDEFVLVRKNSRKNVKKEDTETRMNRLDTGKKPAKKAVAEETDEDESEEKAPKKVGA